MLFFFKIYLSHFRYCLGYSDILNNPSIISVSVIYRRRQWHPTPVLVPENPMGGGAG